MTITAEFSLPLESFPLGETLKEIPGLRIELERIVPSETGFVPFFWVWNAPTRDAFETEVRAANSLAELTFLDEVDGGQLYRAAWDDPETGFITGIRETEAAIIDASGMKDGWRFDVRFTNVEHVRAFQNYCVEKGVRINLNSIYARTESQVANRYQLTEQQYETLLAAYERGYYDEPRGVTQVELADQFGVSQRAISQRLQRAYGRLIESTLLSEPLSA
ncbi:helix-turn-helix domain-containing protein [Halegenticoccus tardaugens]|uniref:helix-turn-helix domain-containing protein n=1 Tax=Halegenticoccus tardaugens TaxID=2071624 RepID=UPI00100B768D|nr:helix-turn-helix domain-containing protein [Halegenticoccus tardaugens]